MTAPALDPAVTSGLAPVQAYLIPLDRIVPSKTNPRKTFRGIDELAEDVERRGVRQAILVRPLDDGEFEIVFGERRYRAARKARLEAIPATIEVMDDDRVLEEQLVENGKREDVHPLEEAEGYEQLEKKGWSVARIAERVGHSDGHIRARLKLCSLTKAAREAFYADKINTTVAQALARVPVALQKQALDEILKPNYDIQPLSTAAALEHLRAEYVLSLGRAPFPIADTKLVPDAGSCSACPKRTGNQPELFSDVKAKDMCTDPTCFEAKTKAFWARRAAEASEQGQKVLTKKETEKVFNQSGDIVYGTTHVDLKGRCDLDPKGRTWEKVLGKQAPPAVLAQDPTGRARDMVPVAAAVKALQGLGLDVGKGSTSTAAGADESRKKERDEQKRKQALVAAVIAAIVERAGAVEATQEWWVLMLGELVKHGWHDAAVDVARRRGIWEKKKRPEDVIRALLPTLEAPGLRALFVEVLATDGACSRWDTRPYSDRLERIAKFYGVDIKVIAKKERAEGGSPKQKALGRGLDDIPQGEMKVHKTLIRGKSGGKKKK